VGKGAEDLTSGSRRQQRAHEMKLEAAKINSKTTRRAVGVGKDAGRASSFRREDAKNNWEIEALQAHTRAGRELTSVIRSALTEWPAGARRDSGPWGTECEREPNRKLRKAPAVKQRGREK